MPLRKVQIEADKSKPFKVYAGIIAAVIGSLLTNEVFNSNPYAVALGTAALAGIAVYLTPNPFVTKADSY